MYYTYGHLAHQMRPYLSAEDECIARSMTCCRGLHPSSYSIRPKERMQAYAFPSTNRYSYWLYVKYFADDRLQFLLSAVPLGGLH